MFWGKEGLGFSLQWSLGSEHCWNSWALPILENQANRFENCGQSLPALCPADSFFISLCSVSCFLYSRGSLLALLPVPSLCSSLNSGAPKCFKEFFVAFLPAPSLVNCPSLMWRVQAGPFRQPLQVCSLSAEFSYPPIASASCCLSTTGENDHGSVPSYGEFLTFLRL